MKIPNLITGVSPKLPPTFGQLSDHDIRKRAEFCPGSVTPAAKVIPAVQESPDAAVAILGAGNGNPSVSFVVPCVPVAQPRQRHRVIQKADGTAFATNYTPKSDPVNTFKASVRLVFAANRPGAWSSRGSYRVEIVAVFPRPKSKTRKRGDNPREPKASKPDVDNLAKAVMDSLTGLAWNDDAQIVSCTVSKWVASADESPHVQVTIETV